MKVCVVTSLSATAEPRAPRHALAAKRAFPNAEVLLVDFVARGLNRRPDPQILNTEPIQRLSLEFPTRACGCLHLAARKGRRLAARFGFATIGFVSEGLFTDRVQGLTRALIATPATVYIAHNIETLLPAARAARRHGSKLIFDCMEYYSEMGDGQSALEGSAVKQLEARFLPACALVLASSDDLADALAVDYGIQRPLATYNTPPSEANLPQKRSGGLNLYWRNSTLGFGQRGLEDILSAMVQLPADVRLFLQGSLPKDGGAMLRKKIGDMCLQNRVTILPPYSPDEAVKEAAAHHIGLCLERRGPRNHELTVSNKMFDYHMAGLAVVSSNLPSLARVIERSGGGLVFRAGDPCCLAETILRLKSSPDLLQKLQTNARNFAMKEGNLEREVERIVYALRFAMQSEGSLAAA